MSDNNFGPWIDWAGGECPIPDAKPGEFEVRLSNAAEKRTTQLMANELSWQRGPFPESMYPIIAYRVRLPADDLLRQVIEALAESRDFIVGLGQSPEAEGWPRDPYAVVMKIETVLAAAAERGL